MDKIERLGTRVLRADPATLALLFGSDRGEDWIVPKNPVHTLVLRGDERSACLTGFDAAGNLVAECVLPGMNEARARLGILLEAGQIEDLRSLDEGREHVPGAPSSAPPPTGPPLSSRFRVRDDPPASPPLG